MIILTVYQDSRSPQKPGVENTRDKHHSICMTFCQKTAVSTVIHLEPSLPRSHGGISRRCRTPKSHSIFESASTCFFPKQFTVSGSKCCKGMVRFLPGCLWSGLRLPLPYLRAVCLPACLAASALSSNRLSPSLGTSGRVFGCLSFIFKSFVSRCLWSGLRLSLFYLRIICLLA